MREISDTTTERRLVASEEGSGEDSSLGERLSQDKTRWIEATIPLRDPRPSVCVCGGRASI